MGATQLNVITYRDGHPVGAQVDIRKDDLAKRADQGRQVY
jgi:hexosaminidase